MTPRQQRDRRRSYRARGTLAAIGGRIALSEPRPGDPPGETLVIKPSWLIFGQPGRQDLGLPRTRRRLEPLELPHYYLQGVRPLHARVRSDSLPAKQKAQKLDCSHRLYLGAQAAYRIAVDPREQPAFAPFFLVRSPGKTATQCEAFSFERREADGYVLRR